jgi:hypothetical protein
MADPPTAAGAYLEGQMQANGNNPDCGPKHWRVVADNVLKKVGDEWSDEYGAAIKLSLESAAIAALILEQESQGLDVDSLKAAYSLISNAADGRPAPLVDMTTSAEAVEKQIKINAARKLPVEALKDAHSVLTGQRKPFDGIGGRTGGSKPVNDLYAEVVYCVLHEQTPDIQLRKKIRAEAAKITGLMPSQLIDARSNHSRRRESDVPLDRLFKYAEREWRLRKSLTLADYV